MMFPENSRLGDLVQNKAAKAVLEKHFPGFTQHPQYPMATGLTLKVIASYPQANISPNQLRACIEDLKKI